ncbi:LOW QUALITY PROTEIN: hypothetical protein MSG28_006972 [Choristoneura fumiferana]|uniref:Uncharacterized protein n=1 Tax=Choristoneura fumiferana TaxID=7141 RepID=A0ACC0JLT9_CHOFU|nr:LOW QUALITY PROTEIN: hypothetical protein MSG28_006972 [Choristoneura fumiferana]
MDLICDAGITPSALKALNALFELSVNTYTSVRILAQVRLSWMLGHYPYSYRELVPKLNQLMLEGGEGDEWHARHKGALYIVLGSRTGPLAAKQDWEVIKTLWPAIVKAPLSEKPSILKCIIYHFLTPQPMAPSRANHADANVLSFGTNPLTPRARFDLRYARCYTTIYSRSAQRFTHFVLQQRKRDLKKITVDPYEIAGVEKPEKSVPGYRKDLEWAMWANDDGPQTDEEWDRPWLRKPACGFYSWPDKIEVSNRTLFIYDR